MFFISVPIAFVQYLKCTIGIKSLPIFGIITKFREESLGLGCLNYERGDLHWQMLLMYIRSSCY